MKDLRNPQVKSSVILPDPLVVQFRAKRLGLKNDDIAAKLGKASQQISQAYKGKQPGTLLRIDEFLRPLEKKAKKRESYRKAKQQKLIEKVA